MLVEDIDGIGDAGLDATIIRDGGFEDRRLDGVVTDGFIPDGRPIDIGLPDGDFFDSAGPDGAIRDTGIRDTAFPDVSFPDVSFPDVGFPDAGFPDTGLPDVGSPDVGFPDAGFPDVGFPDVGFPDAGFPDVGFPDAGFPDVGFPDVGFPDAGFPDVGFPDVGFPDAGFPDVGFPDIGPPDGNAPFCGNGVIEFGEQCDNGFGNTNRPAIEVSQPGGRRFTVAPVEQFTPARFFYGLVSASAHTGFEAENTSNLFLYRDFNTGVLSLFTVHGIDQNTTGVFQQTAQVAFFYSGIPTGAAAILSDDNGEFNMTGPTAASGDWWFRANTDGGILEDLQFPGDWIMRVSPNFMFGLNRFRWVNSEGFFISLDMNRDVLIQTRSTPSSCRLDCTVPFCGDGILDGGEICDDGNFVSGDGCSDMCSSVP